jgi:hypothetical protein
MLFGCQLPMLKLLSESMNGCSMVAAGFINVSLTCMQERGC